MSQIDRALQKKMEEEESRRLEEEKREERARLRQGAIPKRRSVDDNGSINDSEREAGGSDRETMSRRDIVEYYNSLNIVGYESASQGVDSVIQVRSLTFRNFISREFVRVIL